MQYCVISLTLELPDEIYMTSEWSCSASNGYCLRSCCTLCGNNFFVLWQYINFMSQQATTGSLCQAKQCLIGFWSMATPPEACFNLPFFFSSTWSVMVVITSLLWCLGGSTLTASGNMLLTVTVHAALLPCLTAGKPWAAAAEIFCCTTAETSPGSKGIMIIQTKLIVYCTNPGTAEIPNNVSGKPPTCRGIKLKLFTWKEIELNKATWRALLWNEIIQLDQKRKRI